MTKNRARQRPELKSTLEELNQRLATAQTEIKRIADRREATRSKLKAIAKHLTNLEAELLEVAPPTKLAADSASG